ncbi:MAG: type I-B CRISPR-associated protein Cas5b [candidate division WOR-3 bacterium]
MKVITFDIWGRFGHFRKFYTTTSPLTFSFPPPSTIAGIITAILGHDVLSQKGKTNEYLELFSPEKSLIGLKIVNPIKRVRMGTNLINTKDGYFKPVKRAKREPRIQVLMEFIKEPRYTIYVYHTDEKIMEKLEQNLISHKTYYTPSLGLSQLLCNFAYNGTYHAEPIESDEFLDIKTPVLISNLKPLQGSNCSSQSIEFESGKKYLKEMIPIEMNSDRIVKKYEEVIFEETGKTIRARVKRAYRLKNEDGEEEFITFFWS